MNANTPLTPEQPYHFLPISVEEPPSRNGYYTCIDNRQQHRTYIFENGIFTCEDPKFRNDKPLFWLSRQPLSSCGGYSVEDMIGAINFGVYFFSTYKGYPSEKNKADYIASIPSKAVDEGEAINNAFLLHLIDVVWNECTESKEVPSSKWAMSLIKKAKDTLPQPLKQ